MISKTKLDDLIKLVDQRILTTFRYNDNILSKVKAKYLEMIEKLKKEPQFRNISILENQLEPFLEKIRRKPIFFRSGNILHEILQELTLESLRDSISVSDLKVDYKIGISESKSTQKAEIQIQTDKFSEEQINFFKVLFSNKNITIEKITFFLTLLQEFVNFATKTLILSFIDDIEHTTYLQKKYKYQKLFEELLKSTSNQGTLCSNFGLRTDVFKILTKFGLDNNDITEFYQSKKIQSNISNFTQSIDYPTHLKINLESPHILDNTFLKLIEILEGFLQDNNVFYNRDQLIFSKLDFSNSSYSSFTDFKQKFPSKIMSYFPLTKLTKADFNSFFNIIENPRNPQFELISSYGFEDFLYFSSHDIHIHNIFTILQNLTDKLSLKLYLKNTSTLLMDRKLLIIYKERDYISIKLFDYAEFLLKLIDELRQFFKDSMNLKALLTEQKLTEFWDGNRGYLDIQKTVKSSLNEFPIQPMQTYFEKILKTPPIIYLIYDISGSMAMSKIVRSSQVLSLILMSFFERDIYKFNLGYITNHTQGLFPLRNEKEEQRIAKNYRSYVSIFNEYFNYDEGIKDFLFNENTGSGGSNNKVINLLKDHSDLNAKNLKYVFVVTDADFDTGTMRSDFVDVAEQLVRRDDIRFFFVWITDHFYESSEESIYKSLSGSESAWVFPTKKAVIQKLIGKNLSLYDQKFYAFLLQYWDYCHIVHPNNMLNIGEIRYILSRLESQRFFIP